MDVEICKKDASAAVIAHFSPGVCGNHTSMPNRNEGTMQVLILRSLMSTSRWGLQRIILKLHRAFRPCRLSNLHGRGQVWLKMKSQEEHRSNFRNCLRVSVEVRCRFLPSGVETHGLTLMYQQLLETQIHHLPPSSQGHKHLWHLMHEQAHAVAVVAPS